MQVANSVKIIQYIKSHIKLTVKELIHSARTILTACTSGKISIILCIHLGKFIIGNTVSENIDNGDITPVR